MESERKWKAQKVSVSYEFLIVPSSNGIFYVLVATYYFLEAPDTVRVAAGLYCELRLCITWFHLELILTAPRARMRSATHDSCGVPVSQEPPDTPADHTECGAHPQHALLPYPQ